MQPEVGMLARGVTCVTLVTGEDGKIICLLHLSSFPTS